MPRKTAATLVALLVSGLTAGCGGGDSNDSTPTTAIVTPTATTAVTTPGQTATNAPEATATAKPDKTPTETSVATPVPTATTGLPAGTPDPGPPLKFTVTITDSAIKTSTRVVKQNKDMKALLINKSSKGTPVNLRGPNNFGLGSGFIEKGDRAPVYLRSLAAGSKITITAGKQKPVVVKVVG
jgi:hypothetical protein